MKFCFLNLLNFTLLSVVDIIMSSLDFTRERDEKAVYYISPQSFKIMFSYLLAQKL